MKIINLIKELLRAIELNTDSNNMIKQQYIADEVAEVENELKEWDSFIEKR